MRYKSTATIDGKRKYFYGASKKEADKKRDEYVKKFNGEKYLFKTVASKWWEDALLTIAYNTTKGYKPAMERAVKEFGDDDISDIKPYDIASYIKWFSRGGRADKTVRTQLMIINLIFKYAINDMGIDIQNPCRDIEVPKHLKKTKVHSPEDDTLKKIMAADDCQMKSIAMCILYSGLRKGELLALTSDDIGSATIRVNKSLFWDNNKPDIKTPKTEKGFREVPIINSLKPWLPKKKGILFDENGRYMRDSYFQKNWYKWCDELGIHCTPHQLRHRYATMLFDNSVDPKLAGAILGHAQISTTMDIYTDILDSKKKFEGLYQMDIKPSHCGRPLKKCGQISR